MAHNLRTVNGKTDFVAVGQKAWHGLGTYVKEAMTAEQAIQMAGLDFTVEKRPLFASPAINAVGHLTPLQNMLPVQDMFATVRTDTNDVLGVVSHKYEILQNIEAFDFFDQIIDRGEAIYQTAGVLGKGERIFITAKLPEDILVHGEQIENYVLLTTGHDGKTTTYAGFTAIRVVCNNTLTAALKGLQNRVSIFHLKNNKQKLSLASKVMGMASKYSIELNEVFNKMAETRISDARLREYIESVMKPTSKEVITADQLQKEYSTRFTNQVNEIFTFAKDHSTQQSAAARNTVWGAYNSISGYYSFLKSYKSQGEKMQDVYFNGAAKKVETAFAIATAMI